MLKRAGFRCQICGKIDTGRPLHADHIKPIAEGGEKLDLQNGQALCHSCHSRKTATENRFGKVQTRSDR